MRGNGLASWALTAFVVATSVGCGKAALEQASMRQDSEGRLSKAGREEECFDGGRYFAGAEGRVETNVGVTFRCGKALSESLFVLEVPYTREKIGISAAYVQGNNHFDVDSDAWIAAALPEAEARVRRDGLPADFVDAQARGIVLGRAGGDLPQLSFSGPTGAKDGETFSFNGLLEDYRVFGVLDVEWSGSERDPFKFIFDLTWKSTVDDREVWAKGSMSSL